MIKNVYHISYRITAAEFQLFLAEALTRNVTIHQAARMLAFEAASAYSPISQRIFGKLDHQIDTLDYLTNKLKEHQATLDLLVTLSSMAFAINAVPMNATHDELIAMKAKLELNFKKSKVYGEEVAQAITEKRL